MGKSLRLSEKWFRRGLWLVALVFAGFLIGLGGTIVGDLPKVETPLRVDDFLDRAAAEKLRAQVKQARQAEQAKTLLDLATNDHVGQADREGRRAHSLNSKSCPGSVNLARPSTRACQNGL